MLARTVTLRRIVGINGIFTALMHEARHSDSRELSLWWSASALCGVVRRPGEADGYGIWSAHGVARDFFVEWDPGEPPEAWVERLGARPISQTRSNGTCAFSSWPRRCAGRPTFDAISTGPAFALPRRRSTRTGSPWVTRGFRWAARAASGYSLEKRPAGGRSESSVGRAGRGRPGSTATAPRLLLKSPHAVDLTAAFGVPELPDDASRVPEGASLSESELPWAGERADLSRPDVEAHE